MCSINDNRIFLSAIIIVTKSRKTKSRINQNLERNRENSHQILIFLTKFSLFLKKSFHL